VLLVGLVPLLFGLLGGLACLLLQAAWLRGRGVGVGRCAFDGGGVGRVVGGHGAGLGLGWLVVGVACCDRGDLVFERHGDGGGVEMRFDLTSLLVCLGYVIVV